MNAKNLTDITLGDLLEQLLPDFGVTAYEATTQKVALYSEEFDERQVTTLGKLLIDLGQMLESAGPGSTR